MVAARPLKQSTIRRLGIPALAAALAYVSVSCSEKTEVLRVEPELNQPPTIVAQGPTWPSTPIDINLQGPPYPYVIAGDPNGAGDLALAVFSIDAAVIRRIVVRPDSVIGDPYCNAIMWSDSVDITSLLPATIDSQVENCSMSPYGSKFSYVGFAYSFYVDPQCSAFPSFPSLSPYFGLPVKPCGPQSLSRFGIYPPGVPSAYDVNLTFVEIEYQGLRATVYDGAGLTATTTFPNLRLIYRAYGEKASPP